MRWGVGRDGGRGALREERGRKKGRERKRKREKKREGEGEMEGVNSFKSATIGALHF